MIPPEYEQYGTPAVYPGEQAEAFSYGEFLDARTFVATDHMGSVPVKSLLPNRNARQSSYMEELLSVAVKDCPVCSEPMLALEGEWWCLPCQEANSPAAA